jgi:uncharacterized protein (DUF983 family)
VAEIDGRPEPGWWSAMTRGLRRTCPRCGIGRMFKGYLTARDSCAICGLAFEPLRADDAPAYFTLFIVGHIAIGGLLFVEKLAHPPMGLEALVFGPGAILLTLGLLPVIKGAVMGAIYASHAGDRRFPAE